MRSLAWAWLPQASCAGVQWGNETRLPAAVGPPGAAYYTHSWWLSIGESVYWFAQPLWFE